MSYFHTIYRIDLTWTIIPDSRGSLALYRKDGNMSLEGRPPPGGEVWFRTSLPSLGSVQEKKKKGSNLVMMFPLCYIIIVGITDQNVRQNRIA